MAEQKGAIKDSTIDFQKTFTQIQGRQESLKRVCKDLGQYLNYYTEFDKMEIQVEKWDQMIAYKNYDVILEEPQVKQLIELLL